MNLARIAEYKDIDALVRIEALTFSKDKYHVLTRRNYHYLLTKANAEIWVFEIESQICASAILFYRKGVNFVRLYSLAVLPEYQGRGFGSNLLSCIEAWLRNNGFSEIRQEVRYDNISLLNRYKKDGYLKYGVVVNYYPDGASCIKLKKGFVRCINI